MRKRAGRKIRARPEARKNPRALSELVAPAWVRNKGREGAREHQAVHSMDSLLSWSTGLRIPLCRRSGGAVAGRRPFVDLRQFQRCFATRGTGQQDTGGSGGGSFDSAAFEAERNRLDAEARQSMARVAGSSLAAAAEGEDPKAWKWGIRKRIWDLMEAEGIAQNPRPVHHRIPNFVGAHAAADAVPLSLSLSVFTLCSGFWRTIDHSIDPIARPLV